MMKNEMQRNRIIFYSRRKKKNFHFSDGYQISVARDALA